jgi:hypothetical protein
VTFVRVGAAPGLGYQRGLRQRESHPKRRIEGHGCGNAVIHRKLLHPRLLQRPGGADAASHADPSPTTRPERFVAQKRSVHLFADGHAEALREVSEGF